MDHAMDGAILPRRVSRPRHAAAHSSSRPAEIRSILARRWAHWAVPRTNTAGRSPKVLEEARRTAPTANAEVRKTQIPR